MKSLICIVAAIISLALLLVIASKNFDNANGNFIPETTENKMEQETESAPAGLAGTDKTYDFTVVDANGNDVKRSELTNKPMIVLFWTSWSIASRQELAAVWEVYDTYCDSVEFMLVCITDGEYETVESAKAYLAETGYDFPVYFDVYSEALYNYQLWDGAFESVVRTYFFYDPDKHGNRLPGNIKETVVLRTDLIDQIVSIITQ